MPRRTELTARVEAFDSFWEGPEDIERGYSTFGQFYRANYFERFPDNRDVNILVVSCGPGYFVKLLVDEGYENVTGIDSDTAKINHALEHGLPCRRKYAFEFLEEGNELYDVIFCEQELNHLTKDEILIFLNHCWRRLKPDGRLILHGLNGANPITGAEALAQNFDHFNTFTKYSLTQVLRFCGFDDITVFPLNLYVFYKNPLNYFALLMSSLLSLFFRICFVLYGKSNRIFTKKIGAICYKRIDKGQVKE